MIGLETITVLMAKHGLAVVAPIAVLEGPIVSVIAAWLASQHMFSVWSVSVVVILADVVGDIGLYALGRWGLHRLPARWRNKLGLNRERLLRNGRHFRDKGVSTLLFGKWTHSAGAPVLVAAGVARMNFWLFAITNLIATIPKSLFFVALGYQLGTYYDSIDNWIARASLIATGLILLGVAIWFFRRKKHPA